MIKSKEYKGYVLYFYEDKFFHIGKELIDRNYENINIIKNTKRNYVSLIEVNKEKYIYKEPRNEYRIPQRKLMSIFKSGEVLSTLKNIHKLIYEENRKEYCDVYLAITKRKNKMIVDSMMLMEYFPGKANYEYLDREVEILSEIHKLGYYHGDFNPGNFLVKENGEIKIIDTQGKRMFFGKYRGHYDMLTMKMDSYPEMVYPYKKDLWYFIALGMKKIKKIKFIEMIKEYKKKLRDKGWKI